jgi:hypothetical protein
MKNLAFIFTFILMGFPILSQAKSRLITYYSLSEAFEHPNEVQCLILENEHALTSLPAEIEKLENLVILKIKGSSISEMPPELAQLANLHNLEISSSKLKEIPHPITLCKNLEYLNLRNNQIKFLPSDINRLAKLVYLDLGGNQISRLPNKIGGLKQLQQLIMDENKLTGIPSEIGDLSSLHNLILSDNLIQSLPPEIGKLKKLSQLALHRNNLVSLPSEIGNISNLEILLLNSNKLKELPTEIGKLKKLRRLRAAFNVLAEFPSQILEIPELYDVNLRGNPYAVPESKEVQTVRTIPVIVHGLVKPSVIEVNKPVPLTIAILNGLCSSIYLETFSLESNDWDGETFNVDLVDIYRDEKPANLYYSKPEIRPPHNISGPKSIEIEAGETLYIHTDACKWRLRDGWQPGQYKITLRVNNLKADKFCKLSVLSDPICFEIK